MSGLTVHTCDACGGNGYHFGHEYCTGWREDWHRCPVCLGARQFSDQMPTRDAIADAETLRANVAGLRCRILIDAAYEGRDAGRWMRYASHLGCDGRDEAWRAARAAFRAVPGLRE